MINAYFKNESGDLFVDPIEKNHSGLTKITKVTFDSLLAIKNAPPEKTQSEINSALKLAGVLFDGVLCSATSRDMWGLKSIEDYIAAGGSTRFEFENGNELIITPSNFVEFGNVWTSFRQSFFAV
tara:strand:- start:1236 stop:1610 length:375 start_codon:yes stop_codon:yes gene_type:complete